MNDVVDGLVEIDALRDVRTVKDDVRAAMQMRETIRRPGDEVVEADHSTRIVEQGVVGISDRVDEMTWEEPCCAGDDDGSARETHQRRGRPRGHLFDVVRDDAHALPS